jgi:hypothetical protein
MAEAAGLTPLTVAYQPDEEWMCRRVLSDLRAGGIAAVLVRVPGGVEVWRDRAGMRFSRVMEEER